MASSADPLQLSEDFLVDPVSSTLNREELVLLSSNSNPSTHPRIYILVPVASIGCGKTTIGKSLSRLFGWPIIQNDDMPLDAPDRKGLYIQTILNALQLQYNSSCRNSNSPLVVFAERNNHLQRERAQLINDINNVLLEYTSDITYICLFFDHSDVNRLNSITSRRVLDRGDNHKTVQKSVMGESAILEMMHGFQDRFQPGGLQYKFDSIIRLFVSHENSSRTNLDIITNELNSSYPDLVPIPPSADDLDRVFKETILEFESGKLLLNKEL